MVSKKIIFLDIITKLLLLCGYKENTWNFKKIHTLVLCMIMIPIKKFKRWKRTFAFVENQYNQISGLYIKDNFDNNKKRFAIVDGEIQEISYIENMKLIRHEIRQVLSDYNFKNILEVGAGELTTLEDIYEFKNSDIECYGIDLSLNRLSHGIKYFKNKIKKLPRVAKANAVQLPFPDRCFDLIITRHTLEQIPRHYKLVLNEIFRVAKKNIILFEPSYELGSFTQKIKMINSDYVRGIPKYLSIQKNLNVVSRYLMKNSANPLNRTACTIIEVDKNKNLTPNEVCFVCPQTKEKLIYKNNFMFAPKSELAYPIINDIPILENLHSIKLSNLY